MAVNDQAVTNNSHVLRYGFAKTQSLVVVEKTAEYVKVVCCPSTPFEAIQELRRSLRKPLQLTTVSEEEFASLLARIYESRSGSAVQLAENIGEKMDLTQLAVDIPRTTDLLESENDAPVISLLNALFAEAVKKRASDIHLEIFEDRMSARLRIDGILQPVLELPPVLGPLIVSRIKVMAMLNIAEKRLPQDGRITIQIAGSP